MKKILIILILWVLVVNLFALLALNRFNLKSDTAYNWIDTNQFQQTQNWDVVSLHGHWDSAWYLDIAQNGYVFKGVQQLSNIVFFPLYPFLMRLVSCLTFGNFILAGWLLNIVFLGLALYYLYKLVKVFHPEIDPYLPLFLLLIFPTAFFLNAIYTESLFLFLSVAAFYHALKKNFFWAGIFAGLASLTRVTGVLLFVPLMWEYLQMCDFKLICVFRPKILPIFLAPLGILSFFLYHYFRFGDFLLFFKVESWWGRAFNLNKEHFSLFSHPAAVNFLMDIGFVLFISTIIYLVFRRLRVSYGLYMLAVVVVALSSGTLMSIGRYILVLFPAYLIGASLKSRLGQQVWILTSILLLALNIMLFVNNYWAG